MSCLRSSVLARRTMASSARSIMRLETNHSGILNFLWGVFGWQKWSGIAASPRVVRRPDHRATVVKVQGALDNALRLQRKSARGKRHGCGRSSLGRGVRAKRHAHDYVQERRQMAYEFRLQAAAA